MGAAIPRMLQATTTKNPPRLATPARATLRHETHEAHARLEETMRLVAPDLTLAEYVDTLERYRQIYVALEHQIDQHARTLASAGVDWDARRKLPLLRRDLEVLGATARARPDLLPVETGGCTETFAHVMGCLYVLEGSTLGGRVIARHVGRVLGLSRESGASFFHVYGDSLTDQWRSFCDGLERSLPDEAARQRASAGANATFQLFVNQVGRGSKQP